MRARWLWAAALWLGLLAFFGLLALLWRTFEEERALALAQLDAREAGLVRAAQVGLAADAAQRLALARRRTEEALADPLRFTREDARYEGPARLWPPPPPKAGPALAEAWYQHLKARGRLPPPPELAPGLSDEALTRRMGLALALFDALDAQAPPEIELAVRALLADQARERLPAAVELPLTLAAIKRLKRESQPHPTLLRSWLVDGVDDGRGARVEGLAGVLLRRRGAFSRADFLALAGVIEALAGAPALPALELARAPELFPEAPPAGLPQSGEPWLTGGRVYGVVQGQIVGATLDLQAALSAQAQALKTRGLLATEGRLSLAAPAAGLVAELPLSLKDPHRPGLTDKANQAFARKTALLAVCGFLGLALALFASTAQRRRLRFLAQKSDFVATVSHELKTPLTTIRLLAETLERRLADEPKAKDYPTRIVRAADGLSLLVENLLSFNRLDKGRLTLRRAPVELGPLLSEAGETVRLALSGPITLDFTGDPGWIDGDAELLRLVFVNLLRNGCLHNQRPPVLTVHAERSPGAVTLTFTDNGLDRDLR